MKLGRIIIAIIRPFVWLLYPYKIIGKENIPKDGKLILCCNHISMIDPIVLLIGQKRPVHFMAKAELFKIPVVGWCIRHLFGAFPVQRGKGDQSAIIVSREMLEAGKMLGIFIEGTRSKDGKLGTAKSGTALIASQSGAEVLPCCAVTKNQKVRPFRRYVIVVGQPLSLATLHLDNAEKPELRYASRTIMEHIAALMETQKK